MHHRLGKTMNDPIIQSLADLDFYKVSMAYLVWKKHKNVQVAYSFKNRTKGIDLKKHINQFELIEEVSHVMSLRFTDTEIAYLRSRNLFCEEFLTDLKALQLPPIDLVWHSDKDFDFIIKGSWWETIWWETLLLSIVNELYARSCGVHPEKTPIIKKVEERLRPKIEGILENPWIRFAEFGTRRRASASIQDMIVWIMKNKCPDNIIGTSNVKLAQKYDLAPIGTMAHELFMAYSGIYQDDPDIGLVGSHNKVLRDWTDLYRGELSIALNDTYGSDFFWRDLRSEQALVWKGWREDSGNPFIRIPQAINALRAKGADPKTKTCVPSDSLNLRLIIALGNAYLQELGGMVFGWGTDLTFDIEDVQTISIVIKITEASGYEVAKLSNNIEKANGAQVAIDKAVKAFQYNCNYREVCRS